MATLEDINQRLKEANEGMTPVASMIESRELEKLGILESINVAVQKLSNSISPTIELPAAESSENNLSAVVKSIDNMNNTLARLLKKLIAQEKTFITQQTFEKKKEKRNESILSKFSPAGLTKKAKGMLPSMPKAPSLKGLFSGLGAVGLGGGALLGGAGLAGIGASELLKTMQDIDASKIKKNVVELLSIGDNIPGNLLTDGGSLGIALGFIGSGLAVFAAGAGVTAAVEYFTDGTDWAQGVVDSVTTLLSLGDKEPFGLVSTMGKGFALGTALSAIGLGLIAFSAGEGITKAVKLFKKEDWAESVVKNVKTLLTLGDKEPFGLVSTMGKGFLLGGALGAIGAGLIAFSAGEGIAKAVKLFGGDNWAKSVVENVSTLLTLGDDRMLGMVSILAEGVVFGAAMTAIGAGLVAFNAGKGVNAAVAKFSKDDWAKKVVESVKTLFTINSLFDDDQSTSALKEGGKFYLTMTAIGAGLAAFGVGQSAISLAQWTTDPTWAKQVVDNVDTLLSIADLEGMSVANVAIVSTVLGALGAGLAAFGIGGTIAGISEAVNKFAGKEDFAERIKKQTQTLLEIPEMMGDDPIAKSLQLKTVLANVGGALSAFSPSLKDTLKSVGEGIAGFFGADSPFDKIMGISDNSEKLEKSATSLERINEAIAKLGGTPEEQTDQFVTSINKISSAIKNFGGEEGFWANLGASITGFFSKDPLKPFLRLADQGENLFKAGIGVEKIAHALKQVDGFADSKERTEGLNAVITFAKQLRNEQDALDAAAISFSKISKSLISISKSQVKLASIPNSYITVGGPTGTIEGLLQENVVNSSSMQVAQKSLNETKTVNDYSRGGDANINSVSSSMVNNYTSVYSAAMPAAVDTSDRASGPAIYR